MSLNDQSQWDLFDNFNNNLEHELFDSVISEKNDIGGFSILYYIKINTENVDELYGEDQNEEFTEGYKTKILYDPTEETQIFNVFGLSSDDVIQYAQISKSIFKRDIETNYLNDYINETELDPKPGDVIQTLWNNKHYEISELGSEQKIFQGKKLIWEFILKPYKHSEESDSAEDMLFYDPDSDDFPDINETTITQELSAFGDNDYIENEADKISTDPDSSVYGY